MVGWHHWLNGHGFGWAPGVGDGQGGLACCGSWGRKDDWATELNWKIQNVIYITNSKPAILFFFFLLKKKEKLTIFHSGLVDLSWCHKLEPMQASFPRLDWPKVKRPGEDVPENEFPLGHGVPGPPPDGTTRSRSNWLFLHLDRRAPEGWCTLWNGRALKSFLGFTSAVEVPSSSLLFHSCPPGIQNPQCADLTDDGVFLGCKV